MAISPDGFSWSGTLEETDIRSIYGACHTLRFSGWLDLKDAGNEARVLFLGGDPVEISGGDTQRISMWRTGSFRAAQKIPDFDGELRDSLEITGTLAATKPSSLWAWISQYRLSCEIELERPGSKALVVFQNGHAESAEVNGMPELAALARVSSWTDGKFHVRLKPLFSDGVVVAVPPMPDSAPSDVLHVGAKQFDVSRAVHLEPRPRTPWPGERDSGPVDRVESTARTKSPPPLPPPAPEPPRLRSRPTWPWMVAAALVGAAGGAVALYQYHLPPFSPPPKPISEPPVVAQKPPEPPKPLAQEPEPAKEPTKEPVKEPVKEEPAKDEPVKETAKEPVKEEPVKDEPAKDEPKLSHRDQAVEKELQKGRLLLVSGHSRSALDHFRRAARLKPKDASLKVYEQQAQGKLGHAELVLEGHGSIVVDGKKFSAPKKLKLAAGPHVVDAGDGESELTLKRGEKKKLRAHHSNRASDSAQPRRSPFGSLRSPHR